MEIKTNKTKRQQANLLFSPIICRAKTMHRFCIDIKSNYIVNCFVWDVSSSSVYLRHLPLLSVSSLAVLHSQPSLALLVLSFSLNKVSAHRCYIQEPWKSTCNFINFDAYDIFLSLRQPTQKALKIILSYFEMNGIINASTSARTRTHTHTPTMRGVSWRLYNWWDVFSVSFGNWRCRMEKSKALTQIAQCNFI